MHKAWRRLENCCCIAWTATGLHNVLLFSFVNETVEQTLLVSRRGTGLLDNNWNREKESKATAGGRIQLNFSASHAHQTGTIEELC
jgi:hypothetical protein